jgi:hypothetical protein
MSNKNKNAFGYIGNYAESKGLTKREYFAGLAMQGFLSGGEVQRTGRKCKDDIAKYCVELADELLNQLEDDTNI